MEVSDPRTHSRCRTAGALRAFRLDTGLTSPRGSVAEKGKLSYRGIPIEELAEKSTYMEVSGLREVAVRECPVVATVTQYNAVHH